MRVSFVLSFILSIFHVEGYFTIVGSRTFVFGSEYELFVTRNHDTKSNLKLVLDLKGHKLGEEILEKTIFLNFQEKLVVFDVSVDDR